jgi:hypothetical protein
MTLYRSTALVSSRIRKHGYLAASKAADKTMKASNTTTPPATVVPPGYQGEAGNTLKETKYGSELRNELMMRRGGQWQ